MCFSVFSYVTPWHGAGYDFARTFRSKLTYVSPVWYQLRGGGSPSPERKSFSLTGGHDFDEAWVSDVRNGVGEGWKRTSGTDSGADNVTKVCLVWVGLECREYACRRRCGCVDELLCRRRELVV